MFLKSIEIQGFKSFPDSTTMTFGRGITAIVGPNGSGKSNIVDAIRWVLGEQSTKTLRGGKMEDVIFGGTQKRTPQGFCQVSLTLDNQDRGVPLDFNEVMITRRYYRSGESEFFINKKAVRLKDINELFMDTGLGRDGYSVIGQGRIDEILSVKSADRREIFEEAAGITKFRYRKEESEHKLDAVDENLLRVRDIISELEVQVEPLRKQAEKAKSYLIFRDELRVLEVTSWLDSLDKLRDNLQKAQVDYDNAQRMLTARKGELEALYEKSTTLTEDMREKDMQGERVREELHALENRENEIRSLMAVNQTNIKNNDENILNRQSEIKMQQSRDDNLKAQRNAKKQRLEELFKLEATLEQRLQRLTQNVEAAAKDAKDIAVRLDATVAEIMLERQASNDAQSGAAALQSSVAEIMSRGDTIDAEMRENINRLAEEHKRADEIATQIAENNDKKDSASNMLRGFELRREARQKKVEDLEETQTKTLRGVESKTDRLNLLRAMEREFEGFPQAVKRVMQAATRGELRNILGPVSTLIRTADKYSVAIEIALGAAMQNIVTEDEQAAKTAIGYLKTNDIGRATFLPLTALRAGRAEQNISAENGFEGYACGLLQYDKKYEGLVRNLLSGTAVVDNIDNAIAMAKKYRYAFRIVTLDGQLINPSGAMTGGSLNKNVGMLSRANEIARLEAEIGELREKQAATVAQITDARRERDKVLYELQMASDELRTAQDALLALNAESTQHGALLTNLLARKAALDAEKNTQTERIAELNKRITALNETARLHDAKAQALDDAKALETGGMEQAESLAGEMQKECAAIRVDMAAMRAERGTTQTAVLELDAMLEQMENEKQNRSLSIDAIRQKNLELLDIITEQEKLCAGFSAECQQKRQLIASITEAKMQLEGARARCEKESQSKNNELINLERERSRLENKKTQAEMEENSILNKLWENYELTRATAQEVRASNDDTQGVARRIGELRASIKKLGDVSISSIEEYAKISERYEFLTTQRDDLDKAKNDLLKVINELTGSMQNIFAQQFKLINEAFGQTFAEIFGGGSGSLKLEDENDILNCGIEIKVELPGKSMRAISLLSGGEKAFVAIALYFAIIKVRPTPFCVLDEIEAALDEVNVNRFAAYMRTLCASTQFIVITHRRGTMEGSDILYGVTMQEQGVTKLLALNIAEVEQKINIKPN